ncbi:MAG: hypothetical protein ISQ16_04540, partial [Candidatus Actinomarina sp.]|nr:hypothetical protein [Candidatus Actinomarina sp.]
MNRVFFIIILFLFLVIPLTVNNVNDEGISYFDLVVEISENLFEDTKTEEKAVISLTEDQKKLISEKLQALTNSNNNLFNNFEEIQNKNLKKINEYIAINKWQEFSATNSGVKGIYLSGYHFLKEEKIDPIKDILSNTVVNTIVLDVKTDNGHLLYDSEILEVEELKNERIKYDKQTLKSFKEEFNIYLIGRVVAFQDPIFSRTYPESAIKDISTSKPYNQDGQYFLDPSDSASREYILNVALEACLLGFD